MFLGTYSKVGQHGFKLGVQISCASDLEGQWVVTTVFLRMQEGHRLRQAWQPLISLHPWMERQLCLRSVVNLQWRSLAPWR